jgi:hypothetical protein
MKSILFALKRPTDDEPNGGQRWASASMTTANSHKLIEGIEYLGEGCLLISSNSGLPTLASAIQAAEHHKISYKVLFVEATTEWTRSLKA